MLAHPPPPAIQPVTDTPSPGFQIDPTQRPAIRRGPITSYWQPPNSPTSPFFGGNQAAPSNQFYGGMPPYQTMMMPQMFQQQQQPMVQTQVPQMRPTGWQPRGPMPAVQPGPQMPGWYGYLQWLQSMGQSKLPPSGVQGF